MKRQLLACAIAFATATGVALAQDAKKEGKKSAKAVSVKLNAQNKSGESGTAKLLIFSQVVLSLQLPFAVIPLVMFTGERAKMGEFTNPVWVKLLAWVTTAIIVVLNLKLLLDFIGLTGTP